MAHWTARFVCVDGNKDASITKDEFGKKAGDWHSAADANKDGSVTLAEYLDYWVGKCPPEKTKKGHSVH